MTVDINLSDLVNALGLGSLNLSNLDLTDLLGQIGLNDVTVGDLVDELGLSGTGLGTILADCGITTLGGLSNLLGLSGLNEGLGSALSTAGLLTGVLDTPTIEAALNAISLGTLLGDDTAPITTLLNSDAPDLGKLLIDLGISGDVLNLSGLADLSNLSLSDLLGDLGVGDLASITVDPFGGLITELVDIVLSQILAAL